MNKDCYTNMIHDVLLTGHHVHHLLYMYKSTHLLYMYMYRYTNMLYLS